MKTVTVLSPDDGAQAERDHLEGFPKEAAFLKALSVAISHDQDFKAKTLREIITSIAPGFLDDLFEPRVCWRTLRYIGCTWCSEETDKADHPFFRLGNIYESTHFTGANYRIVDYSNFIGCEYFQWLPDSNRTG